MAGLYPVFADPDSVRPRTKHLATIIGDAVRNECPEEAIKVTR